MFKVKLRIDKLNGQMIGTPVKVPEHLKSDQDIKNYLLDNTYRYMGKLGREGQEVAVYGGKLGDEVIYYDNVATNPPPKKAQFRPKMLRQDHTPEEFRAYNEVMEYYIPDDKLEIFLAGIDYAEKMMKERVNSWLPKKG